MKTVVVMPNWVGDCVMAWPVLEALAASGRELTVLAKSHLRSLLVLAPGQPDFCTRGETDATVELLKAAAFHEAVVLPNSFRSAWLPLQAEIPRRWGYRGDLRTLLLKPSVARPRGRRPQVEDYRELLRAMAVAEPASWTPRIELPESLRSFGRERLARGRALLDEPAGRRWLVELLCDWVEVEADAGRVDEARATLAEAERHLARLPQQPEILLVEVSALRKRLES